MKLVIGNKNYSSWSLRAWIAVAKTGLPFDEVLLQLDTPEFYTEIAKVNPALKVPTLVDEELVIWDSLAICEYLNDHYYDDTAWPQDKKQRIHARCIAAEMHSGFTHVRNAMPMNIRATRKFEMNDDIAKDIARIDQIWSECLAKPNKPGWLFGRWSIADAMFLPVVFRFKTYQVKLSEAAQSYVDFALADADVQRWVEDALKESEIVEADEAGVDV